MQELPPEHVYEVQKWLGLTSHDRLLEGLHASRRERLVARHTRPLDLRDARPIARDRRSWSWVDEAIATTYHRSRELQIMALLRPQRLDDQFWRSIYAIMVQGGPVHLGDLVAFVARLTGPRDVAIEEATRRYRAWDGLTYVRP